MCSSTYDVHTVHTTWFPSHTQAFQPSVYIFCQQLQQMSKGGAHFIQQMAFSVAQDTRPAPPSWPAIALPAGQDFVFVQLTIGCAPTLSRSAPRAEGA